MVMTNSDTTEDNRFDRCTFQRSTRAWRRINRAINGEISIDDGGENEIERRLIRAIQKRDRERTPSRHKSTTCKYISKRRCLMAIVLIEGDVMDKSPANYQKRMMCR